MSMEDIKSKLADISDNTSVRESFSDALAVMSQGQKVDTVTQQVASAAMQKANARQAQAVQKEAEVKVKIAAGTEYTKEAMNMVRNNVANMANAMLKGPEAARMAGEKARDIAMPKMADAGDFAKRVKLAEQAIEKIEVAKETGKAMEAEAKSIKEAMVKDIMSDVKTVDFADVRGDSNVNVLKVAGVLNSKMLEASLFSAVKLLNEDGTVNGDAMRGLMAQVNLMKKADAVPTAQGRYVPIIVCHTEKTYEDLSDNQALSGKVEVIRAAEVTRANIEAKMAQSLAAQGESSEGYEKRIRGVVGMNDPLTDVFAAVVDSLIVSDASFRVVTLVYIDHIAKNKKNFTLFTDNAIKALKESEKLAASANRAQSRGMSVEVVESKDSIDEINNALDASFESDVAF